MCVCVCVCVCMSVLMGMCVCACVLVSPLYYKPSVKEFFIYVSVRVRACWCVSG